MMNAPLLPPGFLSLPLAHRGLHERGRGVIENSRAAIIAAIEAGYGVELDLQLSADGEAMVFHDYELERLTGRPGLVAETRADALGEMTLTGGEGVPTLGEILGLTAGRAPLLIEIKDQSRALAAMDGALERRVAQLLGEYHGPVAVMSFNPHSVALMRDFAPQIPRGRTTCSAEVLAEDLPPPTLRGRGRRRVLTISMRLARLSSRIIISIWRRSRWRGRKLRGAKS